VKGWNERGKRGKLTEEICPIASGHAKELLLATRMIGKVRSDVVHLAVEGRPAVITSAMLLQLGGGDAEKTWIPSTLEIRK
jgi:hypothetical protein